ncbi:MAG: hypothetical protein IJO32_05500 [Bacilli bacterium]|nr:hypothetical protein [Bacilli bacterium]
MTNNNNNNELKEYSIKDIKKIKKELLLISPTGQIYMFNNENFDEQVLMLLNKNHVDLNFVIDKICGDLYMNGYEIDEELLNDMKYIIVNFFGFILCDFNTLTLKYPNKYDSYNELTKIQLKILSKLYKKKIKDIFSKEGEEFYETKTNTFENMCYNKGKITKKRIN